MPVTTAEPYQPESAGADESGDVGALSAKIQNPIQMGCLSGLSAEKSEPDTENKR